MYPNYFSWKENGRNCLPGEKEIKKKNEKERDSTISVLPPNKKTPQKRRATTAWNRKETTKLRTTHSIFWFLNSHFVIFCLILFLLWDSSFSFGYSSYVCYMSPSSYLFFFIFMFCFFGSSSLLAPSFFLATFLLSVLWSLFISLIFFFCLSMFYCFTCSFLLVRFCLPMSLQSSSSSSSSSSYCSSTSYDNKWFQKTHHWNQNAEIYRISARPWNPYNNCSFGKNTMKPETPKKPFRRVYAKTPLFGNPPERVVSQKSRKPSDYTTF